jgi:hypothetical protein
MARDSIGFCNRSGHRATEGLLALYSVALTSQERDQSVSDRSTPPNIIVLALYFLVRYRINFEEKDIP